MSISFTPNTESVVIYGAILLYSVIGTLIIPGQRLPGATLKDGTSIKYKLNGLLVHYVGVLLFILFSNAGLGFYNGALVFQNFFPLFTVATIFSVFFATFLYLKATLFKNDKLALHSDNLLVNWVMGAELNPFIFGFEIKANSYRPGFILEHVFTVSALFQQYEQFHAVSSPMLMYQLITFLYLFDCYYYEDGLILMFDIIEENFGFMLLFGDYVFIPFVFCAQLFFLVDSSNIHSSNLYHVITFALFVLGYIIFRGSNGQKRQFRRDPTKEIWGEKPKVIETATKGKNLLVGGYWGMARKINYLGDILIGVAWSMTVGVPTTSNILGYIYPIYLTILLFTRASRDDARCREKYGKYWEEYCKKVKYMIIPYVY